MLKLLYIFAIGLLFAAVVGLGVQAFYPQPEYPKYPVELQYKEGLNNNLTEEELQIRKDFDTQTADYKTKIDDYNRNVSVILIGIALLVLAISILWIGTIEVIGDGVTLGGLFTLLYGLGRALLGGDEKIRFLAVAFGLIVILFLAYWKFIKPNKQKTTPLP